MTGDEDPVALAPLMSELERYELACRIEFSRYPSADQIEDERYGVQRG